MLVYVPPKYRRRRPPRPVWFEFHCELCWARQTFKLGSGIENMSAAVAAGWSIVSADARLGGTRCLCPQHARRSAASAPADLFRMPGPRVRLTPGALRAIERRRFRGR